ncbi:putative membrane protein [Halobacteriovorax marinus SJ]|uniref:Membrane protein n=1 Tax=Halobacteriovorax marinus (strain ATCC BAA-682 / DSM 15412 / SJ) TaxID=862908 RepID=E1X5U4_HALMS|nr:hypothetical protein [Halobacteriovorax marinus]CBW25661.1 putative membrane protein [Halobacteriovorax marinus SJ]
MKWPSLILIMTLISCATVDKGKQSSYEKMLTYLRQGDIPKAVQSIKESPYNTFDFYVITERYNKPVKFTGIKKSIVIDGLNKIQKSLEQCRGKHTCFEKLGWSSAKYFYTGSPHLGLDSSHFHKKTDMSIFDGDINDGSSSWKSTKKYNYREMLSNYKTRTDAIIRKQSDTRRAKRQDALRRTLKRNMSDANFRKCLAKSLLEDSKHNLKVIHHNYGIALKTKHGRRRPERTKKAYGIEVQNAESDIQRYTHLLSKEKDGKLDNCEQHRQFIYTHKDDLKRMLDYR